MARMDVERWRALLSGPGMDTRVWGAWARVTARGYDAEHGAFVDVQYLPSMLDDTAAVGTGYAGDGFGLWLPPSVGDIVFVALPGGESDACPVVVARLWNAARRPPDLASADDAADATDDIVLKVRDGKNVRVDVSGAGGVTLTASGSGRIVVQQTGTADIVLKVASGRLCYVGDDAGAEPIALGSTLKTFLDSFGLWADSHIHNDPVTGATSPPTVTSPSVPDVRAQKGRTR